jgi:hypothetical protein
MLMTLLGTETMVRLVQPENAESPMRMTPGGIVTLGSLMQAEKA